MKSTGFWNLLHVKFQFDFGPQTERDLFPIPLITPTISRDCVHAMRHVPSSFLSAIQLFLAKTIDAAPLNTPHVS